MTKLLRIELIAAVLFAMGVGLLGTVEDFWRLGAPSKTHGISAVLFVWIIYTALVELHRVTRKDGK